MRGVSMTTAVMIAVEGEIERLKSVKGPNGRPRKKRSELLMEFAKECGPLFKDGRSANELINDLYDEETGLPK